MSVDSELDIFGPAVDLTATEINPDISASARLVVGRLVEEHIASTAEPLPHQMIAVMAAREVGFLYSSLGAEQLTRLSKDVLMEMLDPELREAAVDEFAAWLEREEAFREMFKITEEK